MLSRTPSRTRRRPLWRALLVAALLLAPLPSGVAAADPSGPPVNRLVNGDAEDGVGVDPQGWTQAGYRPAQGVHTWDAAVRHAGNRSLALDQTAVENDLWWQQTVPVTPGNRYRLSGWVRTEGVTGGGGARISTVDSFDTGLSGTNGWTYVSTVIDAGTRTTIEVAARLGGFGAVSTGRAWFDDVALVDITGPAVAPGEQPPGWKVLVLVYPTTDFTTPLKTINDETLGSRRYTGTMTAAEQLDAVESARLFAERDVPLLTSGFMVPEVTIRTVTRAPAMARIDVGVDNDNNGTTDEQRASWWVDGNGATPEINGDFDSVIVLWNSKVRNETTGQTVRINGFGGLTPGLGLDRTFSSISAPLDGDRNTNVFKHEFGHAILAYHDTVDPTRQMRVEYSDGTSDEDNHTRPGAYVDCRTGADYVWEDETPTNRIPNSTYSNESGFTHGYYSGTVATAADPTRCLGIPRDGWAVGGPLTLKGDPTPPSISVADASVQEGNSGPRELRFTVRLSEPTSAPVSVRYAAIPGSASTPGDFSLTPGTVTVPRGQQAATVAAIVVGDTAVEGNETFTLQLDDAVNAFLADPVAIGTIVEDDARCNGRVPTLSGTTGNDTLIATSGADVVVGLGGSDRIEGRDGNDTVCGGDGDDVLVGGNGTDRLEGGAGADRCLDSGSGTTRLTCESSS